MKQKKIKKIKAVIMDCDGVLTDGGMYYSANGDELKKFNTKDGMAIKLLQERNFLTGIITGENNQAVQKRADKLHLDFLYMGIDNKLDTVLKICQTYNLKLEEIAYIGDDINDIEVLKSIGFAISPKDAEKSVKKYVDYVTKSKGGQGVIREITNKFFLEYE